MGAGFAGQDEPEPTLNCETDTTNEILGDSIYLLSGDTSIFDGVDLTYGDVEISFPLSAINEGTSEIVFSEDSLQHIKIISSWDHERRMSAVTGDKETKYVLVIRVSGYSNGHLQEVASASDKLAEEIFHWGNNNLVSLHENYSMHCFHSRSCPRSAPVLTILFADCIEINIQGVFKWDAGGEASSSR